MNQFGHIGFTEEQVDLLNVAERFCREKSPMENVRALMVSARGYDETVWAEIGALGWLGIAIPENYGGSGLTLTELVPVCEQMGRAMMASPFTSTSLAAQALIAGGTEAQKLEILPQIAAGMAATLALSEPNGDWDLSHIDARAIRNSKGYSLSGKKTFVMDFQTANWVIISALLEGTPALFVLKTSQFSHESFRREVLIDETKRSWELVLDGIDVDESTCLDLKKTTATLHHIHLCATLLGAAELTGGAQSCIEYTVEYLNTRTQFGRLIGSFQALKHPTVNAFVEYQKSRSLLYAAAFSFNQKGAGEVSTRMAKVQADKTLSFAADRSIQFHGGFGFTYACDAQLYRRRAIFIASQFGDAHYHKKKLADLLL